MQEWTPLLRPEAGPKYLAIAEALSHDIAAGRMKHGDRLPSQRSLAAKLGVDLTTVTRAYREAQRLGLIEGDGRRGSFIRKATVKLPHPDQSVERGGGMNTPPDSLDNRLSVEFRRSVENVLSRDQDASFRYHASSGMAPVRQAGANVLRAWGVECTSDNLLVTAGGQHALHAIFSTELKPGDRLALGKFAYPGALSLARRFGVELRVIEGDDEGMIPQALEEACQRIPIKAVYLVPTNDNPTTVTMPGVRREALAQVISAHGLRVIEDDAYGLLPRQPIVPFAALVPEATWHIASLSKVLSPGLRVAWLRAPDSASAWRLGADLHETAIMPPPLNAAVIADWISSGVFQELVDDVRNQAHRRQAIAREVLSQNAFAAHEDGYHLWMNLGEEASPAQISEVMRGQGISAIPGEAFSSDRSLDHRALRVSIGGGTSETRLRNGLELLATLLRPEITRKSLLV